MEHIRDFDWCASSMPDIYFVKESDIDNCVTERILRNKFHDPLTQSDSEEEKAQKVNWKQVFKRQNQSADEGQWRFIAGMRAIPAYPRVSALTAQQHYAGLRIFSSKNPGVLPMEYLGRIDQKDRKVWHEMQEAYEAEQQEYIAWAKSLWTTSHCIRALRPKPTIEMVYEAQYTMKAAEMAAFPKQYHLAAQISLEGDEDCKLQLVEDLVRVRVEDLPEIRFPELMSAKMSVLRPCPVPEPCNKHPTSFVLPNEKTKSVLPVSEVHKELGQYALDHECRYVASESALRCLLDRGSHWTLPITVHATMNADGGSVNVLVLGSEFAPKRESARTRTARAMRHLLEYALVPPLEKARVVQHLDDVSDCEDPVLLDESMDVMTLTTSHEHNAPLDKHDHPFITFTNDNKEDSDSDCETTLQIALDEDSDTPAPASQSDAWNSENMSISASPRAIINIPPNTNATENETKNNVKESKDKDVKNKLQSKESTDTFYKCSCKDSLFKLPPPRSFKRWQIEGCKSKKTYDLMIHCSHKARCGRDEVVIQPIPEYQIDLGGSRQTEDSVRAAALALALRRNASLVTARVCAVTGEIVTVDSIHPDELSDTHGDQTPDIGQTLHAALTQLTGLLPGHYLLLHEPCHGRNALLYATGQSNSEHTLMLDFDTPLPADEASSAKVPPTLAPVLLPVHKYRKILPCAFTVHADQVAKEPKKPPVKQKQPPQALRWPKRKRGKGKKNSNRGRNHVQ